MTADSRHRSEHGAALIIALLVTVLLAGIAAAITSVTITETLIAGAHRHARESSYAADAAIERALLDLASIPDWTMVLLPPPAHLESTFVDGLVRPKAPDGRQLDLAALTLARQRDSDARAGPAIFGADAPQWRLFAHSALAAMLPVDAPAPPAYVLVWVADDGLDGDGDPSIDTNRRLLLFADAYGGGGARRSVEAAVGRSGDGVIQVLAWLGASSRLQ